MLVRQILYYFFPSAEYNVRILVKAIPISSDQGKELLKFGVDTILLSL